MGKEQRKPSPVQFASGGSITVLYRPDVQLHMEAPCAEELELEGQGRQYELLALDLN
jgi:hypothetical protein